MTADIYTKSAALVKGSLAFIATTYWFGSLIDQIGSTSGSILGFSWHALILAIVLSVVLVVCHTYCHAKQDTWGQGCHNHAHDGHSDDDEDHVENSQALLSVWSRAALYIGALADAIALAGLFTSLVKETLERAAGYVIPGYGGIILLVGTFIIAIPSCMSEFRTHKKAFEDMARGTMGSAPLPLVDKHSPKEYSPREKFGTLNHDGAGTSANDADTSTSAQNLALNNK